MRLLPGLLILALAGCEIPRLLGDSKSEWYEVGPVRKPLDEVVQVTRDTVARLGYRLFPIDAADPRIESDWDTHLSPHWCEGYRTKIEIEFDRLGGDGGIRVRVRSQREMNNDGGSPTVPERAQWVSASVDDKQKTRIPEPALKIRQLLKFKFETRS